MLVAQNSSQVSYLGLEKGLSNNAVTDIFKDHNGFMWFTSYEGLNKYDGYEFKVFTNRIGDTNSLVCNLLHTIDGDQKGHIWVGGQKGASIITPSLSVFSQARYYDSKGRLQPLSDEVHIIRSASKHGMLMGTVQTGALLFGADSMQGRQLPAFLEGRNVSSYDVPAIAYDSASDKAYLFVRNRGLCVYDFKSETIKLLNTQIGQAYFLKTDGIGRLWLGNEQGLYRYHIAENKFDQNLMPVECIVSDLSEDRQGTLWIATNGKGVWRMAANEAIPKQEYHVESGIALNSNATDAIFIDNDDRKWIGTLRGGINKIEAKPLAFQKISYDAADKKATLANFINAFCEDSDGNIWIGTSGAGLRCWYKSSGEVKEISYGESISASSLSSSFVTGIIEDSRKDIWIATWHGGVNRYNRTTNKFDRFSCFNPDKKQEERNIWLVYEDKHQRLWASATNDNGNLYLFNRKTNAFEPFDSRITNIQAMAEDSFGNLWAGSYTSLIKLDPAGKKHVFYDINNTVRAIHEDASGRFWIGTQGGGLLLLDRKTGKFKQFSTADGLPGNTVLRILEDKKGNLWFSSFNGLSCFSPKDHTIRNFSTSDGLQSPQFSFNAGLRLLNGKMLFGGIKGFNLFDPDSIQTSSWVPPLRITAIRIANQALHQNPSIIAEMDANRIQQLTLPYNKAALSVDFAALEFSSPEKIDYAYYLEGWDKDWNYEAGRTASYTRLTEGNYILHIKSSNDNGSWQTSAETMVKIIVLPPWYRSWWAYCLYALLGIGAIWMFMAYRKKQTRLAYEVKLAHLEAEKEKELHEKKLTFFTNISHEFRTPLTLIISPVKELLYGKNKKVDSSELGVVYRNARRLLSLVDQLLLFRKAESEADSLRVSKVDFAELCQEVFLCFTQQAEIKHLEYHFEKPEEQMFLYLDREKIEISLFNLVSNAIKYTPANGRVTVAVQKTITGASVVVEDDGPGISREKVIRLFERFYQAKEITGTTGFGIGLYVARTFVEKHKGSISFENREGRGACFKMSLMAGQDHFDPDTIFEDSSHGSAFLEELVEEPVDRQLSTNNKTELPEIAATANLVSDEKRMLVIDDSDQIRNYIAQVFSEKFKVFEAESGETGLEKARQLAPDIIISDVVMSGMTGIELCRQLKSDESLNHIPVILLTASSAADVKLKGIECGADDYITKPFEKDLLTARVDNLLKSRNTLQKYFYNEVTLQENHIKISKEYKAFLETCMKVIEENIDRDDFSIKMLAGELGMSHSNLYKKVKSISGQSVNAFIRFIRLRKAAELFIHSNCNVSEAAFQVGIGDVKYFRDQFNQLFGLNPSEYIRKYRKPFQKQYSLNEKAVKSQPAED